MAKKCGRPHTREYWLSCSKKLIFAGFVNKSANPSDWIPILLLKLAILHKPRQGFLCKSPHCRLLHNTQLLTMLWREEQAGRQNDRGCYFWLCSELIRTPVRESFSRTWNHKALKLVYSAVVQTAVGGLLLGNPSGSPAVELLAFNTEQNVKLLIKQEVGGDLWKTGKKKCKNSMNNFTCSKMPHSQFFATSPSVFLTNQPLLILHFWKWKNKWEEEPKELLLSNPASPWCLPGDRHT